MVYSLPRAYRRRDTSKRHPIWVYHNKFDSSQIELFKSVLQEQDLSAVKNSIHTILAFVRNELSHYIKINGPESSKMTVQVQHAEEMQIPDAESSVSEKSDGVLPKAMYICDFLTEDKIQLFSDGSRVIHDPRADAVSTLSYKSDAGTNQNTITHTLLAENKRTPDSINIKNTEPIDDPRIEDVHEFAYMTSVRSIDTPARTPNEPSTNIAKTDVDPDGQFLEFYINK